MAQPFKDAIGICKTLMRNGYDAYVVNARMQQLAFGHSGSERSMDICTEVGFESLQRLFPDIQESGDKTVLGVLKQGGMNFYFYPANVENAAHPEETLARMTPRLLKELENSGGNRPDLGLPLHPQGQGDLRGLGRPGRRHHPPQGRP